LYFVNCHQCFFLLLPTILVQNLLTTALSLFEINVLCGDYLPPPYDYTRSLFSTRLEFLGFSLVTNTTYTS